MLRMCICMHSRFVENHPIRILEDGLLISEVVLSQRRPLKPGAAGAEERGASTLDATRRVGGGPACCRHLDSAGGTAVGGSACAHACTERSK
jgi:hypothetical protein